MRTGQPLPKPIAMQSLAANRAAEQRDTEKLALQVVVRNSAQRIAELTDLVAELADRVAVLESR